MPSSKPKPAKTFGKREIGNLIRACHKGDLHFVLAMLEQGVDPNVLSINSGAHPLTAAANGGHRKIVSLLLEAGADPNVNDTWVSMPPNGTPLENAADQGHLDIVKLLLERGAVINRKGHFTPLRSALSNFKNDIVRFLLEAGAEIEPADLIHAVWRGNEDGARQLLEAGAKVNISTNTGESPLHFAAGSKNARMVENLIHAGADVNVQSDSKLDGAQTPLHKAAFNGRDENIKLLLEAGADPLLADRVGKTPEDYAKRMRHKAAATLLREWVKNR